MRIQGESWESVWAVDQFQAPVLELAGVFIALKPGHSVRILIDSEIAMRRLRSLTRGDCRPREYEFEWALHVLRFDLTQ